MNNLKSFLFILAMAAMCPFANAWTDPNDKKLEITQMEALLKNIPFKEYIDEQTKLLISFYLNDKNEVIVLSTNIAALDTAVKNALNFEKIESGDLKKNQTYTLPVTIK